MRTRIDGMLGKFRSGLMTSSHHMRVDVTILTEI